MTIQHISYDGQSARFQSLITIETKFNEACVFDDYDLNIIDLTNEAIWRSRGSSTKYSVEHRNIKTLSTLLSQSKISKSLILLPGNVTFKYAYSENQKKYREVEKLKDVLDDIQKSILQELYPHEYQLSFGKTVSKINGVNIPCDFYFSKYLSYDVINTTQACKVTTIQYKNVYFTTLQLRDATMLKAFLCEVGLMGKEKETSPVWFAEIKMFNDTDVEKDIEENKKIISNAEERISASVKILNQNNYWKSILYTTGEELAETVKQMLDKVFGTNLSEFIDINKEDFRFEYAGKVVIGEIKGVEKNVKKAYISQLDTHVQEYLDDHPDKEHDDIVALLIVNHERKVKPSEREAIPDEQIRLSERNGSLIIESDTLLKLFEEYMAKKITERDCWKLIESNIGLLSI